MFRGRGARFDGPRGRNSGKPMNSAKGLFIDNIWHCDCSPRLPAEHFKVKKEGKNQGRWFYTCQQPQDSGKRCGFFLWDEDAKLRMEAVVLSNRGSEPGSKPPDKDIQYGWDAGRGGVSGKGLFARNDQRRQQSSLDDDDLTASPSPSPSFRPTERNQNVAKRNAQAAGIDEDDFFGTLSGQEEAELARVADAAAPTTPQKAQKTGIYATPATSAKRKLPWLETPVTSTKTVTFDSALDTPSRRLSVASSTPTLGNETQPETPVTLGMGQGSTAPPKTRYKDALNNPADATSSLTSEALAALASAKIPPEILANLRSILTKHDLKTQGVTKGRDISRLALKAKDAKIAELNATIASLEAERELDRGMVKQLRWDADHGGQSLDDEL